MVWVLRLVTDRQTHDKTLVTFTKYSQFGTGNTKKEHVIYRCARTHAQTKEKNTDIYTKFITGRAACTYANGGATAFSCCGAGTGAASGAGGAGGSGAGTASGGAGAASAPNGAASAGSFSSRCSAAAGNGPMNGLKFRQIKVVIF